MFLVELKKCSWTLCVPQCSMIWSLTTSSTAVLITVSLSFPPHLFPWPAQPPYPVQRDEPSLKTLKRSLVHSERTRLKLSHISYVMQYRQSCCSILERVVYSWALTQKKKSHFHPEYFVFTCMHLTYAFIQSDLQKRNKAICQRANNARFIRQLLKSRFVLKQCSEWEKNKMKQRRWARSM